MITTSQLAEELGIYQRAIQKRIARLGITPKKIGKAFVLTSKQADLVRLSKSTKGPAPKPKP